MEVRNHVRFSMWMGLGCTWRGFRSGFKHVRHVRPNRGPHKRGPHMRESRSDVTFLLVIRLKTKIFFVNVPLKLLSPEAF